MASSIGIRTANGEFYPILEENSAVEKRLILTTVHHKQTSVHIDLYRSDTETITEAGYIGSLVVEHIKSTDQGEPSIELIISSNEAGEITAEAVDLDAAAEGEPQRLKVSLKTDKPKAIASPDFTIDAIPPDYDHTPPDYDHTPLDYDHTPPPGLFDPSEPPPRFPWGKLGIMLLGIILICFLIWWFLLGGRAKKTPPPAPALPEITITDPLPTEAGVPLAPPAPAEPSALPEPEIPAALIAPPPPPAPAPAEPPPVPAKPQPAPEEPASAEATLPEDLPDEWVAVIIEAPVLPPPPQPKASRTRRPPVASYKVPFPIPREGAAYKIRWGDTLWDISEAFYRNPWLYPRIARFNKIRNPDLIIAGTTIRVPPKQ